MIRIRVEVDNIEGVKVALENWPRQARWALRSSINKNVRWTSRQGLRDIARAHEIPLRVLSRRRRAAYRLARAYTLAGSAWFGTASIAASYLGVPRQTKAGARVRNKFFPGAFVATMPTGHVGIFRRAGKSRLPITQERVKLDSSLGVLRRLSGLLPARLSQTFAQDFNYAVNVRGRGAA